MLQTVHATTDGPPPRGHVLISIGASSVTITEDYIGPGESGEQRAPAWLLVDAAPETYELVVTMTEFLPGG
jgi:hypothetical protein